MSKPTFEHKELPGTRPLSNMKFISLKLKSSLLIFFLSVAGLALTTPLSAWRYSLFDGPHKLSIGPEAYRLKKSRAGGSYQHGWLVGVRGVYERIVPNGFYWAAEAAWAKGPLSGENNTGEKTRSKFTDAELEARLGATLQWKWGWHFALTPFGGFGYADFINDFQPPSRYKVCLKSQYSFSTGGFLFRAWTGYNWCVGFLFKARQMYEGTYRIRTIPNEPSVSIVMGPKTFYVYELPISWRVSINKIPLDMSFTPFYRTRHFGGREGVRADFYETKFYLWGMRLLVTKSY